MALIDNNYTSDNLVNKGCKMKQLDDILNTIILILLIVFSIFIIYQLIVKILGGSWETQDIVIALLILMMGLLFNVTIKLAKLETNFSNFKKSFHHLANDFKILSNNFKEHIQVQ
jgi:uncharacterized integral membrane protein